MDVRYVVQRHRGASRTPGPWGGSTLAVLLAVWTALACGPRTATVTPTAAAPDRTKAGAKPARATGDPTEAAPGKPTQQPPRCGEQGTRWDGSPGGCLYEHAGCCYPDPASLCTAAGCPANACTLAESRPAQALCT